MAVIRALDRKLFRDIARMWAQAMAIAVVIGCGVATFVMAFGALVSLDETREAYYERYRFGHIFGQLERAPERVMDRIRDLSGVIRADSRIVVDVILDVPGMDAPAQGRLISLPEGHIAAALNDIALHQGRLPAADRPDEVVVSESFATANGFVPGDRFHAIMNGRKRALTIVGTALSPEYVYAIAPGQLVPDAQRFAITWMNRTALEAAYDLDGAFNDVSLRIQHLASEDEIIRRLDLILESYGGTAAYGRDKQVSHAFLRGELDQLQLMGRILPPIFLGVAAFLLYITITRLVEQERRQVGLLKAFGYRNSEIGAHYLKLVSALIALGVLVGLALGVWLGRGLTEIYANFFRFPFLYFHIDPKILVLSALIAFGAGLAGTWRVVYRVAGLAPAVAMSPPAPPVYGATFLERLGLLQRISEATRMILRHLTRWPVRALMTMAGLAAAVAIMIASLFSLDAIDLMIETFFFDSQRQDATITFHEPEEAGVIFDAGHLPGVLAVEGFRTVPVKLRNGRRVERTSITGQASNARISRLVDDERHPVAMPEAGLVLTSHLAEELGVSRADNIEVEVLEGRRGTHVVPVAAVVQEYIGLSAFMDLSALNVMMDEGARLSGVYLSLDRAQMPALFRALKETPETSAFSMKWMSIAQFRNTIAESMSISIWIYTFLASSIAVGVVYNSARISLSERRRELATLKVLGFSTGETAYILLGELWLLTLLSLPVGSGLGYLLSWYLAESFSSDLFRVPLVVDNATYGVSIPLVTGASFVSGLLVTRRLFHLNLVEALKTRE